jgi:hypothetical protein
MPRAKIIEENGKRLAYCNAHKEYLPIEDFGVVKALGTPRPKCRKCEAALSRAQHARERLLRDNRTDEEVAMDILKLLGYDLNNEVPVWQQFLIRHQIVER